VNLLGISANTCGINMAEGLVGLLKGNGRGSGRRRRKAKRPLD
jgi:hypothetical protein